jgi:hypothetical protein
VDGWDEAGLAIGLARRHARGGALAPEWPGRTAAAWASRAHGVPAFRIDREQTTARLRRFPDGAPSDGSR